MKLKRILTNKKNFVLMILLFLTVIIVQFILSFRSIFSHNLGFPQNIIKIINFIPDCPDGVCVITGDFHILAVFINLLFWYLISSLFIYLYYKIKKK